MDTPRRVSIDDLLAHRRFVRVLARRLVGDPDRADDVEQETWTSALRSPPIHARGLTSWLARLVRHRAGDAWRTESRRRRAERDAVPAARSTSPEETVAKMDTARRVVDAVAELPEPYRTTVVLRFYDDLSVSEIAARMSVPEPTVRTRLTRAFARLRARLGGDEDERDVWLALLLPPPRANWLSGAAMTGAIAMSVKLWIAAGATAALLVAALLADPGWLARDDNFIGARPPGSVRDGEVASTSRVPNAARRQTSNPPAAEPPLPPRIGGIVVGGRVVDERRQPAAAVEVRALREDRESSARTGDDGRFEIEVGEPSDGRYEPVGVHAVASDGRAGGSSVEIGPGGKRHVDAGTLVLVPCTARSVRVLDAAGPVPGALVQVAPEPPALGAAGPWIRSTTGADGTVRLPSCPSNHVTIHASLAGRGRGSVALDSIPRSTDPIEIRLSSRTVRVTVVRAGTGEPLPGEVVDVRRAPREIGGPVSDYAPRVVAAPTGADGTTRIDDVGADDPLVLRLVVRGRAPSPFDGQWDAFVRVEPGRTEARIEAAGPRTIRWGLVAGDAPVPPDGTVLTVREDPGSFGSPLGAERLTVTDGEITAVAAAVFQNLSFFVEAPDGSSGWASANSGLTRGPDVRFDRPRRIEVTARAADGSPAADAPLGVYTVRKLQFGSTIRTDASGRAVFERLPSALTFTDVCLRLDDANPHVFRNLATVDLRKGDAQVSVTVPREIAVILRLNADGARRLPPRFNLICSAQTPQSVAEDPESGEIRFTLPVSESGPPLKVILWCEGFHTASLDVPTSGDGPVVLDVPLTRVTASQSFLVRVQVPEDASRIPRRFQPFLERWSETGGRWVRSTPVEEPAPPGSIRTYRATAVTPGRFRLTAFELHSPPCDVSQGDEDPPLFLDLSTSRFGPVKVRVVGPEGASLDGAEVVAFDGTEVLGRTHVERGAAIVWLPGDRTIRLVAEDFVLSPDPAEGSVEVVTPRDGVTLRLVEGPTIEFRVPGLDAAAIVNLPSRVWLLRGDPAGTTPQEIAPQIRGDRVRLRSPGEGMVTLLVDLAGFAPREIRDVRVTAGRTDLGELALDRGAVLKVKLTTPTGQTVPTVSVSVAREDGLGLPRYALTRGEAEIVISALGQGRHKVTVTWPETNRSVVRTLDVTGRDDVVVEVPAR